MRITIGALLALSLATAVLAADSQPETLAGAGQAQAKVYGKTYGEWSAAWWEWVVSIPGPDNPLLQDGETDCGIGQGGKVWFLAGTVGGAAERSCTIPAGKALLYPLLNSFFYNGPGEDYTEAEKRAQLDFFVANFSCQLNSSLNGVPTAYSRIAARAQSPGFTLEFPAGNIFGVPAGHVDDEVIADGHWVMIPPLTEGEYELSFGGVLCDPSTGVVFFETQVTYFLSVVDDEDADEEINR
jgi:hypothetical protein